MERIRERVFPLVAGGLYLWFLILDVTRAGDSTWVKFAAICLCFLVSLTGLGTADGRLVALALALTVGADWFLLVLDDHYRVGVALFLVVQLLYAHRLYLFRGQKASRFGFPYRLLTSGVIALAALSCAWLSYSSAGWELTAPSPVSHAIRQIFLERFPLLFLPLCYFANLCINAAEAFALSVRDRPTRRFAWGLLLFVACDICVGAWNLGLFPGFARVGMWLFYLPSQVLIVLSQRVKGASYEDL